MGFGKRTRENQDRSCPVVDYQVNVKTASANATNDGGGDTVRLAGAVVALVAFGYLSYSMLSGLDIGFGSSDTAQAHPIETKRTIDMCTPDLDARQKVGKVFAKMRMGLKGDIREADMLVCLMTRNQRRLCNASNRSALANDLIAYFKFMDDSRATVKRALKDPTSMRIVEMGRKLSTKSGSISRGAPSWDPDPSVIAAMQDLVRTGYLSQSDFGWYAPKSITSVVEKIEQQDDACAS